MMPVPVFEKVTSYYLVFRIQTHLSESVPEAGFCKFLIQLVKMSRVKMFTGSIRQMAFAKEPYAVA